MLGGMAGSTRRWPERPHQPVTDQSRWSAHAGAAEGGLTDERRPRSGGFLLGSTLGQAADSRRFLWSVGSVRRGAEPASSPSIDCSGRVFRRTSVELRVVLTGMLPRAN